MFPARLWLIFGTLAAVVVTAPSQTLRDRIQRKLEEKQAQREPTHVSPKGVVGCGGALNLGFRLHDFAEGRKVAIWYPSKEAESEYSYVSGAATALAPDAPVADCQAYPLVVFSHGFGGCAIQSLFFTEALARAGYIVAAPDHKDAAICNSEQGRTGAGFGSPQEPIGKPAEWTEETYRDRADDIQLILDGIVSDPQFGPHIDRARIGAAGHSLGGYTIMGMAGGWRTWRDERIKAAVLFSPYLHPFLSHKTVGGIHIPVMYQSGTFDLGVDPWLKRPGEGYDSTAAPKFFVEIRGAAHGAWSNLTCVQNGSVPQCIEESPRARLINEYAIAFFEHYLKGKNEPVLSQPNGELADYRSSVR